MIRPPDRQADSHNDGKDAEVIAETKRDGDSQGVSQGGPTPPIEAGEHCDVCGAPMYGRHCKLVCATCGYLRDCSDP